jgi:tetratricopeptide (TPR) repeat protein
MSAPDAIVPAYLGRVLSPGGEPAGTCFQVSAGVLVTAAHVLNDLDAGTQGTVVSVDPLGQGERRKATVARIEPLADLAVLTTPEPFSASVPGLVATDGVPVNTQVVVSGVVEVDDPGRRYRHLDAPGTWAGTATFEDHVPLGRIDCKALMPGMSGAPVRRLADDRVVGVVSGRYNSTEGWLRDTAWVARTEHIEALCQGLADLVVARPAPDGRVDLILEVTEGEVRLRGEGIGAAAPHRGVSPGLVGAVDDVRRHRARAGLTRWEAATKEEGPGELALARAGQLLAASFLPSPVAEAFELALSRAKDANQGLRLGVKVSGPLARLPWEALPTPGDTRPLALHPLIDIYRQVPAVAVRAIPGPLRIVVAIASPETGGGELLDYERELRNVLAAVRAARAGDAHVRVIRFATTAAIRSALEAEEGHVLHISAHGSPGSLVLEDEDGGARELDADQFVEEAVPPGAMPPLICLAACHTNVAAAAEEPSFAARLLKRGATAVVATETSVTDRYATRLFARLYGRLAEAPRPEVVGALCDARRAVQADLDTAPEGLDRRLAALEEWAVVTVAAPEGRVALFDPAIRGPVVPTAEAPRIGAVAGRAVGDFVGRRREQRRWPAELGSPKGAGLVLHGIGGVGKTTLASELITILRARQPERLLAQLRGEVSVEDVFREVAAVVRRQLYMEGDTEGPARRALDAVARRDLPWQDRLALLQEHALGALPLLVVLDNFEDNLADDDLGTLTDPTLAEFLAAWVGDPRRSRLLVTSRYRFCLPHSAEAALAFRQLGPLSFAETRKLVWSLPALDRLSDGEVETVWRMVGGHPRTLEYIDALLSSGMGRYPDITTRLNEALRDKLGAEQAERFLAAERTLDAALSEAAVLAADDVLLDDLLASLGPEAESLLIGASVYRQPVDLHALSYQMGNVEEAAASTPDRKGATQRIGEILEAAGVDPSSPFDAAQLPQAVFDEFAPHLAELGRRPTPPRRAPEGLDRWVTACTTTTLLSVEPGEGGSVFYVHRWTASELERRWGEDGRSAAVAEAHRRAAQYWRWRVAVWPQDRVADVHDLLEARHHLLAADEVDEAGSVTEDICSQLHEWGAWDQEDALVHDTLRRLLETSKRRPVWIQQLGILAHDRGDYEEAERRYHQSLEINERLGNQTGMANSYHNLGILAQNRGDYEEAERRYHQSLEIKEPLGNQTGMANSYHNLGTLAQNRGDYEEAERRYHQSLEINERLGNQTGMATSYSQLGILLWERDASDQAVELHVKALEIRLRLGLPEVTNNLRHLGVLRKNLRPQRFSELLSANLDDDSQAQLHQLIDQFERGLEATEEDRGR